MMDISMKLKKARMTKNLTQETVAEKIGVTRQTISNWENGKSYPDIVSIIMLSDVYEMTLDSLLKGDDEMIEHLKESTNVVKSNKQLVLSYLLAGVLSVVFILIRIFVPIPKITGIVPNIIAMAIFVIGTIIVLAGSINIQKIAEQQTSNKTLLKIGVILLYMLIYIPLILIVPEAVSSEFEIKTDWINALIRVGTAMILILPACLIYRRLRYLFS